MGIFRPTGSKTEKEPKQAVVNVEDDGDETIDKGGSDITPVRGLLDDDPSSKESAAAPRSKRSCQCTDVAKLVLLLGAAVVLGFLFVCHAQYSFPVFLTGCISVGLASIHMGTELVSHSKHAAVRFLMACSMVASGLVVAIASFYFATTTDLYIQHGGTTRSSILLLIAILVWFVIFMIDVIKCCRNGD